MRWLVLLVLLPGVVPGPGAAEPPAVVARWAPRIVHDVDAAGAAGARDDYLCRFDFDGDWDPVNNQANLESGAHPLPGAVYYGVIETETHWWLTYAFFHPVDTSVLKPADAQCVLHENDMEGVTFLVRKDGTPDGELRLASTEAHGEVYTFTPEGSGIPLGTQHLDPATGGGLGPDATQYLEGGAPLVFVEASGHGVGSAFRALTPTPGGPFVLGGTAFDFPDGDGLVYVHDGQPGEDPDQVTGTTVRYDLMPLAELWDRRFEDGPGEPYCDVSDFTGGGGCSLEGLAWSFKGSCWPFGSCAANPPWGWESDAAGSPRGEWFLDPARVTGTLHVPGLPDASLPGFFDYVDNPYLAGETTLSLDTGGETTPVPGFPLTLYWSGVDEGQGPSLGPAVAVDIRFGDGDWEFLLEGSLEAGGAIWTATGPAGPAAVRARCETECGLAVRSDPVAFTLVTEPTSTPEGPPAVALSPPHPNPLRGPGTRVLVTLDRPGRLRAAVHDGRGRRVRTLLENAPRGEGVWTLDWDGADDRGQAVAAGLYWMRVEAVGGSVSSRRVVVLP